ERMLDHLRAVGGDHDLLVPRCLLHHTHRPGYEERVDVPDRLLNNNERFLFEIESNDKAEDSDCPIGQGECREIPALRIPLAKGQDERDIHELLHGEVLNEREDVPEQVGEFPFLFRVFDQLLDYEGQVAAVLFEFPPAGDHGTFLREFWIEIIDRDPVKEFFQMRQRGSVHGLEEECLLRQSLVTEESRDDLIRMERAAMRNPDFVCDLPVYIRDNDLTPANRCRPGHIPVTVFACRHITDYHELVFCNNKLVATPGKPECKFIRGFTVFHVRGPGIFPAGLSKYRGVRQISDFYDKIPVGPDLRVPDIFRTPLEGDGIDDPEGGDVPQEPEDGNKVGLARRV